MLRRPLALLAVLVPLAALAAGCGARSNKPYTATGTAPCLTKKGFAHVTTDPLKIDFIAGVAENGGLRGTAQDGNVLTIAFAADAAGAAQTRQDFKANASPFYKRHINDVMESKRNAVLVWTTSPSQQQIDDVIGCLGS